MDLHNSLLKKIGQKLCLPLLLVLTLEKYVVNPYLAVKGTVVLYHKCERQSKLLRTVSYPETSELLPTNCRQLID